jgi:hypothetical protein
LQQKLSCALSFQSFEPDALSSHQDFQLIAQTPLSPVAERLSCRPLNPYLNWERVLLRKEVIQPQVPLRLPCYDFIPVTAHTLGPCFLAVSTDTSGTSDSHDVTGGVYKARERIHGVVADTPLLAIPASCRRVAAYNPNWAQF